MIYNVAEYLEERKKFKPQEHTIEVDFNLIPLTAGLIQELKDENESHAAMLAFAARKGVSIGRDRVCDDEELAQELADMWCLPQFSELEISLIDQVGEKVCAISGLTEFIENKKLEEETEPDNKTNSGDENPVNGDDLPDGQTDLGNLSAANLAHNHANNGV